MLRSNFPSRAATMSRNGKLQTSKRAYEQEIGSDDDALVTSGNNGRVEHLGSDLPEPLSESEEVVDVETSGGAQDTDMGQEQSRQELQARSNALRQAARGLEQPIAGTGKLKPARKQIVEARLGKQRPLTGPRPSQYDTLQSPEKTPMRTKNNSKIMKQEISPRKQLSTHWKQSEAERELERQKQLDEQLDSSGTGAVSGHDLEQDMGAEMTEDEVAGGGGHVEPDDPAEDEATRAEQAMVDSEEQGVAGRSTAPDKVKRKSGRPRKDNSVSRTQPIPAVRASRPSRHSACESSPGNDAFFQPSSGLFSKQKLADILKPKQSDPQRRSLRTQHMSAQPNVAAPASSASNSGARNKSNAKKTKQSSQRSQMYINKAIDGDGTRGARAAKSKDAASTVSIRKQASGDDAFGLAGVESPESAEPAAGIGQVNDDGLSVSQDNPEPRPAATIILHNEDVIFEPDANQENTNNDTEYSPLQEAHDEDTAENPDEDALQASHTANSSKKRKAATSSHMKKAVKRSRVQLLDSEDDEEEESLGDAEDSERLFGQWEMLQEAVRAAKRPQYLLAQANNTEFEELVITCNDLAKKLAQELQSTPTDERLDVAVAVKTIIADAEQLCEKDDFTDRAHEEGWGCDCFSLLIPSLTRLLGPLVTHFEHEDTEASGDTQATPKDLRTVLRLADSINRLAYTAGKNTCPDPDNPSRQKVKQKIIMPLRDIKAALSKQHTRLHNATARRERADHQARQSAIDSAARVRQNAYNSHIKHLRNEWTILHNARYNAYRDDGLPTLEGEARFGPFGGPECYVEHDANGQPFSRLQVFPNKIRVGPSPTAVADAEARFHDWSNAQLSALMWVLEHTPLDRNPLRRAMKILCARRGRDAVSGRVWQGELRKFNATEIVIMAERLRENLVWEQTDEFGNGEVEEWVRRIPVWSKPHAWGKENELMGGNGEEGRDDGEEEGLFVEE